MKSPSSLAPLLAMLGVLGTPGNGCLPFPELVVLLEFSAEREGKGVRFIVIEVS